MRKGVTGVMVSKKKKPEFEKWLERGRLTEYQAKDAAKHFQRHRPTVAAYKRKKVLYVDLYCKKCETGWELPITKIKDQAKDAAKHFQDHRPTISAYRQKGVLYMRLYCKQCETGWKFSVTEEY